jgi:hypothetical protein
LGRGRPDFIKPAISDNVAITHGNHSYKLGLYFERLFNREAPGGNWSGTLDFGTGTGNGFVTAAGNTGFAYSNALLGNFNSYTEQLSRPFTNLEMKLLQWYVQDSWKITRSFTSIMECDSKRTPVNINSTIRIEFYPARLTRRRRLCCTCRTVPDQPNGIPAFGTACAAANQFAVDPRIANPTGANLLNRNLSAQLFLAR